jgi:hypothetical protein
MSTWAKVKNVWSAIVDVLNVSPVPRNSPAFLLEIGVNLKVVSRCKHHTSFGSSKVGPIS